MMPWRSHLPGLDDTSSFAHVPSEFENLHLIDHEVSGVAQRVKRFLSYVTLHATRPCDPQQSYDISLI